MTLEGTNTYVVGEGPVYVIDPGPADERHIGAVRAAAEERGGITGVLLTHSHGDHAEGVALLDAPVIEGAPFDVIPTPGHADDHVCFVAERVCFTGDLILGEGSTIISALGPYLDSLARLGELELEVLCPGHGRYVTDPEAKIREYIEHRLERERRLVTALDAGERSRARLLDLAWDDVPAAMRPMADVAMQAHLEKLEAEGRLPGDLRD